MLSMVFIHPIPVQKTDVLITDLSSKVQIWHYDSSIFACPHWWFQYQYQPISKHNRLFYISIGHKLIVNVFLRSRYPMTRKGSQRGAQVTLPDFFNVLQQWSY